MYSLMEITVNGFVSMKSYDSLDEAVFMANTYVARNPKKAYVIVELETKKSWHI